MPKEARANLTEAHRLKLLVKYYYYEKRLNWIMPTNVCLSVDARKGTSQFDKNIIDFLKQLILRPAKIYFYEKLHLDYANTCLHFG